MRIKLLIFFLIVTQSYSDNYKHNCVVPDILIETVKMTENETLYPFFIRTNDSKSIENFYSIAKKYNYKKTDDIMLIDCMNQATCISIAKELVNSNITNLDLGLYQVNYDSYPNGVKTFFDEIPAYKNACSAVIDKIKIHKKWSWEVLAAYHSASPKKNKIYKDKLIANYIKLTQRKRESL